MTDRTCSVCGKQPSGPYSWALGQPACSGVCYGTAVALALAARRRPLPAGAEAPPLDRSPVPVTEDIAEGRDPAFRIPRPRRPWKPTPRPRCATCRREIPPERGAFRRGLRAYCTLTCLEDAV
jgi:hypothetical protein